LNIDTFKNKCCFYVFFQLQELRDRFEAKAASSGKARLLLTAAVAAGVETISKGYDVQSLGR